MSYPKSPKSVVETEEQKSTTTPELHPIDTENYQLEDFPAVADHLRPVAKPRSRWPLIAALAIAV
jgi:hypothetical protein